MKQKISIIDYDCGNVMSIKSALQKVGATRIDFVNSEKDILNSNCLILPGVGAFGHAMRKLNDYNLISPIKTFVENGGFVLGICLGMQMLFDCSDEMGSHEGLGLIKGNVKTLQDSKSCSNLKIPNIGWRPIFRYNYKNWDKTILLNNKENDFVYYVHSYIAHPNSGEDILAVTKYGGKVFPAVVNKKNIFGCQFHPEKSGPVGLKILRQFLKIFSQNG